MEGYYDGTKFHRLIPGFIIQGGDPTNTGSGGESIYGESFGDEFHTRLKFRYRGILGVANGGKGTNTNGSQFLITLDKQDYLNNNNTMFGRVVGNSIYNLVNLVEDVEVDKSDRPVGDNIPRIISAHVLENPFPDIAPRQSPTSHNLTMVESSKPKPNIIARRGGALSFRQHDQLTTEPRKPTKASTEPVSETKGENLASPPTPKPPLLPPSTNLLSEIEKLKMQIQKSKKPSVTTTMAAGAPSKNAVPATMKTDVPVETPDDQLAKKLKSWSKALTEGGTGSTRDWLNSGGGGLKFAIDSKIAYQKRDDES